MACRYRMVCQQMRCHNLGKRVLDLVAGQYGYPVIIHAAVPIRYPYDARLLASCAPRSISPYVESYGFIYKTVFVYQDQRAVLHLAAGQAFRVYMGELLYLRCRLHSHRIVHAPAQDVDILYVSDTLCHMPYGIVVLYYTGYHNTSIF